MLCATLNCRIILKVYNRNKRCADEESIFRGNCNFIQYFVEMDDSIIQAGYTYENQF